MRDSAQTLDFTKVLVANRGEIARRIFRTLREMGIATVAVFSGADRDASFVEEADEAVRLGPAPGAAPYLDQQAVIAAAEATGAEAIHPGYGFLAENARFAERCGEQGLVFIGPAPEAIRRMGNKAEAKALAAKLGVPVVDGFSLAGLNAEEIRRKADDLGWPLLVKAAAGVGGKGMRVVRAASALDAALSAATREAEAAFGDGSLLVERFVDSPRHVEVQIMGDARGHIVYCFERDCSVQRRHQKVFEESPSPAVDAELRRRMGEAAVALAGAVDYQGAGTVEFLLEANGTFSFLEMNTRLQVEHPVTEAVTGLDLVRLQIEIAQGRPLGFDQSDLELAGHAVEARLYAEDPGNDFLPATGTVVLWAAPEVPGVRIDSGVEQGSRVTVHYDPLLAKVIAHGRDRGEALRRLHRGLSELAVGGLVTNRDFLLAVLEHDAFRRAEVDTAFIDRHLPPASRLRQVDTQVLELHAVAATLHLFHQRRKRPGPVPAGIPPGWRNNRWRPQEQAFEHAGASLTVRYVARGRDRFTIDVATTLAPGQVEREPRTLTARSVSARDGVLVAELDGVRRRFRIGGSNQGLSDQGLSDQGLSAHGLSAHGLSAHGLSVHGLGRVSDLTLVPRFPKRKASAVAGGCAAPMTGRVVEVAVAEGDRVKAGATLVVLEAMKMEHRLEAHAGGMVRTVRVEPGQMVDPDDVLVVVAPLAGDGETEEEGADGGT